MTGASLKSLTREELEAEILRLRAAWPGADGEALPTPCRDAAGIPTARASSAARQRAVFTSAIDFAMVVTDTDGIITDWNPGAEHVMGWTAAEMCGQDATRFFTPEDRAAGRIEHEMQKALQDGRANDERWHLRKDGQRFWASGEMMPLHEEGVHLGFVKILRDRTEQREALLQQQAEAAFMHSVLASSANCIKVLDLDTRLTFMNEGGMKVMEISDFNDVQGCPWPEFWVGQGHQDVLAAVAAAKAGGVGHFPGQANTYRGTPRWWDVQVTPIPGPDGQPNKLLAVSRDISDQKAVERQLAASEARWRGLFDGMQEGFFLGELVRDTGGRAVDYRFLEINPAFARQSGLPVDSVGQTIRTFVPDIDQWLIDNCARVVETGEPTLFEINVPGLNRTFEVRANKDRDDRFSCLFLDITGRKQAETALQASEARLLTVMETVPVGILVAEAPSGRILMGNGRLADMLGHGTLYASSSNAYDGFTAFHADGSPVAAHEYPLARLCTGECDQAELEAQYQRPDGQRIWIVISGAATKDAEGQTVGAVVAVSDISQRKAAEVQQDLLNRELSHRMKNTLAIVQAIATQTLRNARGLDEARDALSARLVTLGKAHDMLLTGQGESADVRAVIEGALELHDDGKGRFILDGPALRVGGSAALSLALMTHELATNAAKYGALRTPKGRVRIDWTITGDPGLETVQLRWQESGGPPVVPPTRRGFGSRLIERGLAGAVGGEVVTDYPPEGVICTLTAPLAGFLDNF
ncbi:PAS domain S-box protein [Methylobacterium terricola]|uniref:Blue-light-activated histidine kinase n=1 Tax=Methylobacterium terricola TaxID=2583531 RepID=A0A5C4LAT8_9HYPH|nr:PAS domain S-box protein [Methylobacterium terricola]TNC08802.1 PAS domain S-box protein [Methylobacterium terricola]